MAGVKEVKRVIKGVKGVKEDSIVIGHKLLEDVKPAINGAKLVVS